MGERLRNWQAITLALVSAILGVFAESFIAVLAPPLFQPGNLPYMAFIISSLLFLLCAIYVVSSGNSNAKYFERIDQRIDTLANKIGLKATYFPIGKGNKDSLFDQFKKLIEEAETEIFIVTYHVVRELNSDTPPYLTDARQAYYAAMQHKLETKNKKAFRFRRIIQILEGNDISSLNDPIFMEHLRKLTEIGEHHPEFASLKKCKPFTENTYIMIDRRLLISQIAIIDPDEGGAHYNGFFLFEDPSGSVMRDFMNLFNRIDARSVLVKPMELHYDQVRDSTPNK